MNRTNVIYWTTTSLMSLMMAFSAYAYFTNPEVEASFRQAGFPSYFRMELGIGKFLGAILLLAPVAARLKEWVYAAFGIVFISAAITHIAMGDPMGMVIAPLVFFGILIVSYLYYHKMQTRKTGVMAI